MKKTYNMLLNIVCFLIFAIAILHIAIWKIQNWETALASLDHDNRNYLYFSNIIHIMNFFAMLILSTFYREELLSSKIGKFILGWFAAFWFLHIILELILGGNSPDFLMIGVSLFIGVIYLIPLVIKKEFIEN
jgi:hypothetical protein